MIPGQGTSEQGLIPDQGFPHISVGKESACNAGDPGLIFGLGRCTGEGIRYPLQDSGLENSMDCIVHRVTESDSTEQFSLSQELWSSGEVCVLPLQGAQVQFFMLRGQKIEKNINE